jgi:hypothetical protein
MFSFLICPLAMPSKKSGSEKIYQRPENWIRNNHLEPRFYRDKKAKMTFVVFLYIFLLWPKYANAFPDLENLTYL